MKTLLLGALASVAAHAQSEHVPPDPPQSQPAHMSYERMVELMQMDDTARFGRVMVNHAEWRAAEGAFGLQAQAYYGGDYHKAWLKTEGDFIDGDIEHASAELLWDRVIARWWSLQAGVRHDFGIGASRDWLAVGISGLAPHWLELEATVYAGEQGRTALHLRVDYELLITQRLVLQPEVETYVYGKEDRERRLGSGVSQAKLGVRLRYEIKREIAPYVGVEWVRRFGDTADLAADENELGAVAGLRIWF